MSTDAITTERLREWLVSLASHNPGGRHAFYRVARVWFRWLVEQGDLEQSPLARIKAPRVRISPLEPVTIDQVRALLGVSNPRDRALILFLFDTGVRAGELVSLNVSDVNLSTGLVQIRNGKGGKSRVVVLGVKARRELVRYLRRREGVPLFTTDDGHRLGTNTLRQILRRRCRDAGICPRGPHAFRRAFALAMLRGGSDVHSLQLLMGHADLSILRRYLAQTEDDLRAAHERAGPVDHLL